MSVFDKTNTGTNAFGSATFTCTTTDVHTPCLYARDNGVGSTTDDQVVVDFPTTAPGVALSALDTPNLIRVTATRTVSTALIRFVAPATATVKAQATAGHHRCGESYPHYRVASFNEWRLPEKTGAM